MKAESYPTTDKHVGSALIMTIVLTVLLAIIGTYFLVAARVDKIATSARSDSEDVKLAVESIVGHISQTLADDVPGRVDANGTKAEFYDYPGDKDKWLAVIEPDANSANSYKWRQVSDLYGRFVNNVGIAASLINDYQAGSDVGDSDDSHVYSADADGDGVADSKWVKVPSLMTGKGKPVYAAIRIIDNSGMLNVNTAYKFDPNSHRYDNDYKWVDGSSQMQIDLETIAIPTDSVDTAGAKIGLHPARCDDPCLPYTNFDAYKFYAVWVIPTVLGTPFDISDELDLRNRYFLKTQTDTRLQNIWHFTVNGNTTVSTPFDGDGIKKDLNGWFARLVDPNGKADRRHLLTTVNMDRVIDAQGDRMCTINDPCGTAQDLYKRLLNCIDSKANNRQLLQRQFAQIAANIWDCRDSDSNVTSVYDSNAGIHCGFEKPCIYVSELVRNFWVEPIDSNVPNGPRSNDPNKIHRSYAIELYKQYDVNETVKDWRLKICDSNGITKKVKILDASNVPHDVNAIVPLDVNMFDDRGGYFYVKYYDDANTVMSQYNEKYDPEWLPNPEDGVRAVPPNHVFKWGRPVEMDVNNTTGWYADFYLIGPGKSKSDMSGLTASSRVWHTDYSAQLSDSYTPPSDMATGRWVWRIDVYNPEHDGNNPPQTYYTHEFYVGQDPNEDANSITGKVLDANDILRLERWVVSPQYTDPCDPNNNRFESARWVVTDSVRVPRWFADVNEEIIDSNYWTPNGTRKGIRSYDRDLEWGQVLRRMWDPNIPNDSNDAKNATFANWNHYSVSVKDANGVVKDPNALYEWPRNHRYTNVGDTAMTLRMGTYYEPNDVNYPAHTVGYSEFTKIAANVRLDMTDPNIQRMFQYITVLDPYEHTRSIPDPNYRESTRVKGRININTAPYQVIAQLPWVSQRINVPTFEDQDGLAKAIVAYRDKTVATDASGTVMVTYDDANATGNKYGRENGLFGTTVGKLREEPGFESVGELTNVFNENKPYDPARDDYSIRFYAIGDMKGKDITLPDLHRGLWSYGWYDEIARQYLIFARISDLTTVRSDVFTAYILVRLGTDGPQRRMIAILDRSEVTPQGGRVKVVALQPVPDPR